MSSRIRSRAGWSVSVEVSALSGVRRRRIERVGLDQPDQLAQRRVVALALPALAASRCARRRPGCSRGTAPTRSRARPAPSAGNRPAAIDRTSVPSVAGVPVLKLGGQRRRSTPPAVLADEPVARRRPRVAPKQLAGRVGVDGQLQLGAGDDRVVLRDLLERPRAAGLDVGDDQGAVAGPVDLVGAAAHQHRAARRPATTTGSAPPFRPNGSSLREHPGVAIAGASGRRRRASTSRSARMRSRSALPQPPGGRSRPRRSNSRGLRRPRSAEACSLRGASTARRSRAARRRTR